MNIRPATLANREAIMQIAVGNAVAWYPELKVDRDKIWDLVTEAISSARHKVLIAEQDGEIVGVLAGMTGDNLWAQRQNCSVMLWVSYLPGAGYKLLRHFRDWVLSRRAIKVSGFSFDIDVDSRIFKMVERAGFTRHGCSYLMYN